MKMISGKFQEKYKLVHTVRPKGRVIRKKIKVERSTTPQRWSRRIRSLPPIPYDVPEFTVKRSCRNLDRNKGKSIVKVTGSNEKPKKSKHVIIKKEPLDPDTLEIVRVVPIIVYKKNKKAMFKTFLDNYEIEIKKGSAKRILKNGVSQNNIHQKIKRECSALENKWSKMLKALPATSSSSWKSWKNGKD